MIRAASRQRDIYLDMDHLLLLLLLLRSSDSVRLLNGSSLCSGRLEVKSNQSWSSVCEADFDQQDAEVVCRELGCGPPSVLQGALYGKVEAPLWSKEFQCGGHESALLDCRSSGSARNSCSPGKAVGLTCSDPDDVRLVGGASRCADSVRLLNGSSLCSGRLEVKSNQSWSSVCEADFDQQDAEVVCREFGCGPPSVLQGALYGEVEAPVWSKEFQCGGHESALLDCRSSGSARNSCSPGKDIGLTCSDSVRLLNGSSLCSGRLEVKSNQSWSSVCEADFDQQDAEVVCRELGCGPPSVLQGALYGEVEAPVWSKEFQCGGHESALLDCRSSGSARNSCSPGKAVGLTCSEPVRLVGEAHRCAGTLEVKHLGEWRPVDVSDWTLKEAAVVCEQLDCGLAVSVGQRVESSDLAVWVMRLNCVQVGSPLRECATSNDSSSIVNITCSGAQAEEKSTDSVRLLNGSSLCSGRLEVKSNQSWSSVCEADFDQQEAEVVCRELGCGPPSVLQGALYGEVEAPVWSKEFQCGGHESALLDCRSSGSARNSCSPGKAVGLTCSGAQAEEKSTESDDVRLVGGASRCAGILELKHLGEWRAVKGDSWTRNEAAVVCEHLDCGFPVSVGRREDASSSPTTWWISRDCLLSRSLLGQCAVSWELSSTSVFDITCSDSVRLLNGSSLCSGRLEVKSNQSWSSVCEADFDQQDAEVVCRELGCGPPSVLQGALYGEVEAPVWSKEFQCGGHESALLDCRSSISARNSCSPGKAVGLTCSDSVRLLNGSSLCSGRLEVKSNQSWSSVCEADFDQQDAEVVCRELGCGPPLVLQGALYGEVEAPVWSKEFQCGGHESALLDCRSSGSARNSCSPGKAVGLTCSDSVRLLDGSSLCSGRLEVKSNQSWSSVCEADFDQQDAEVVCRELGCGPHLVLQGALYGEVEAPVWSKEFQCGGHESALLDCRSSGSARNSCSPGKAVGLTCSDSVRLLNGSSLCSGRLEVKSNQSWSSVCEADFDQQDAEVVCRELGCGPPLVLQGALYGEVEAPVWSKEFQCGGHESALLDCRSSGSARNSCSPGKAVGLTCSGYGPSHTSQRWFKLLFDGDEKNYELWETRFLAHMELRGLGAVLQQEAGDDEDARAEDEAKNGEAYAELVQCLDDKSLSLVMRDARNNGRKALEILREHYAGKDKPRVTNDTVTFSEFKTKLRSYESTERYGRSDVSVEEDNVMKTIGGTRSRGRQRGKKVDMATIECYTCGKKGHMARTCLADPQLKREEQNWGTPQRGRGRGRGRGRDYMNKAEEKATSFCFFKMSDCPMQQEKKSLLVDCGATTHMINDATKFKTVDKNFKPENHVIELADGTKVKGMAKMRGDAEIYILDSEGRQVKTRLKQALFVPSFPQNIFSVKAATANGAELHFKNGDNWLFHKNGTKFEVKVYDSVRLLNGSSLCSGRLEVKSNQSWSSVCEADFDQQDAEVVCRELGCGPPSALQAALYGEVEAPVWSKAFQCGGHETALLDCRSSGSARNSCSPGKAVGLTCSEPEDIRLEGGASRCDGRLEIKHLGEWRPTLWSQTSPRPRLVSPELSIMDPRLLLLLLWSSGVQACNELISKESVRLVGGASRCAGTLELKHLGEWRPAVVFVWTPKAVAEGERRLHTGVRAEEKHKPTEIVRLVGGASRCAGTLELKHLGEWRAAVVFPWSYKALTLACEHLDCGAAVSLRTREETSHRSVVQVSGRCVQAASAFWGVCVGPHYGSFPVQILDLTCTDSVRLLNGSSLCSGRLEVKSNQSWSSVCEADFDQQDAEVVCRELGCGPPSALQGALYGEVEAPVWSKEFQCGGHESALLDCRSSGSARNSCSPGKAVGLTCSEPVRLVGGASRCDGVLELKHLGQWRPAESFVWSMETAAVFCEHLGCGSAVSFRQRKIPQIRAVWSIFGQCLLTTSTLQDCVFQYDSDNSLYLTCSGQRAPVRLRRQQGGGGVLVWAGIIKDELVGPFRVEDGVKLNSQSYCQFLEDTFFKQWYRKKSASFKKNMIFMQDNAPSHASKYSTAWLARKGIKEEKLMTWPPCSPDLNPIENLWSIIKCEIYKEGKQYTSLNSVWEAVVAAARNVDGEQIKTLTESMDGRLLSVLAKKGGYIGR
ncbi:hypothetical protein ACER0C_004899 [Sarotherodon galilaeus]